VPSTGPRGGDGVELVRVVEDGGLGRLRRAGVVLARDCVQELGPRVRIKGNARSSISRVPRWT
jgi:hypothetical protein